MNLLRKTGNAVRLLFSQMEFTSCNQASHSKRASMSLPPLVIYEIEAERENGVEDEDAPLVASGGTPA